MKRMLAMALALVVTLTACGGDGGATATTTTTGEITTVANGITTVKEITTTAKEVATTAEETAATAEATTTTTEAVTMAETVTTVVEKTTTTKEEVATTVVETTTTVTQVPTTVKVETITTTTEETTTAETTTTTNAFTTTATTACFHEWQDATCTAPRTCCHCGATEGSALGHGQTKTETIPATCFSGGAINESCTVCHAVVNKTFIPETGEHTYVAKSCTEAYFEARDTAASFFISNIAAYHQLSDWMCNICSVCHIIKQGEEGDIWSKYSDKEQCERILQYVNTLRQEHKAANPGFYNILNDKLELVYDEKLTELANIRAKELYTIEYSHDVGTRTGAAECISYGRSTVESAFEAWKASPGHYDGMVWNKGVRFGYGRYISPDGIVYNCLLVWDKYWTAQSWEIAYG